MATIGNLGYQNARLCFSERLQIALFNCWRTILILPIWACPDSTGS